MSSSNSDGGVREFLTDVFNMRFVVYQQVCPSEDLNLPQKEMILFAMKMATFCALFFFLITYKILKNVPCWWKLSKPVASPSKSSEETSFELTTDRLMVTEDEEIDQQLQNEEVTTLSITNMLKCTFIKLVKLYFTPIASSALMMVHCVNILGESHLYVYGDHICYSGWQLGIIIFLLPCVVLFPLCFEMALRLLKSQQITSWQFVLASMCPFYAIGVYVWKRNCKKTEDSSTFTSNEEEPFRNTILEGKYINISAIIFSKVLEGSITKFV